MRNKAGRGNKRVSDDAYEILCERGPMTARAIMEAMKELKSKSGGKGRKGYTNKVGNGVPSVNQLSQVLRDTSRFRKAGIYWADNVTLWEAVQ
jgi:hypothetical protein